MMMPNAGNPYRGPPGCRWRRWVDSAAWPSTSLYRRHRPQSFDEVVGQEHVVRTLRNAVERDRVHHAYLFVGSRGTGKTSMAKILARSLNCVNGPTADPVRRVRVRAVAIAAGTSLDVIEMDAASNRSVDDIRDLRERVGYAPAAGRWKVYILDEAHMLTTRGLERLPEDARGAAAEHRLRPRDDRAAQGDADDRRPLPALRLPAPLARADRRGGPPRRRRGGDRDRRRRGRADLARRPPAASATRSAPSTSSSPTAAASSRPTTCSRCSASPTPSSSSAPPTRSPPATAAAVLEASSGSPARAATRPVRARPARPPAPAAGDPVHRRGARRLHGDRRRSRAPASPGRGRSRTSAWCGAIDALAAALAGDPRGRRAADDASSSLCCAARARSWIPRRRRWMQRIERLERRWAAGAARRRPGPRPQRGDARRRARRAKPAPASRRARPRLGRRAAA